MHILNKLTIFSFFLSAGFGLFCVQVWFETSNPTLDLTQPLPSNMVYEAINNLQLGSNLDHILFATLEQHHKFWWGQDISEPDNKGCTVITSTSTKAYTVKMEEKHFNNQICAMAKLKVFQSSKPSIKIFSVISEDEDDAGAASSTSHAGQHPSFKYY